MAYDDDTPRIVKALEGIKDACVVTTWPKEEVRATVVLVTLAGESALDRRDDREYLTELTYYVRVFASKQAEQRRVVEAVESAMLGIGYERDFRWQEDANARRQTVTRYKTVR